jgi:hypothetical protein
MLIEMFCEDAKEGLSVRSWAEDVEGVSGFSFPGLEHPVWTIFRISILVLVYKLLDLLQKIPL